MQHYLYNKNYYLEKNDYTKIFEFLDIENINILGINNGWKLSYQKMIVFNKIISIKI